MSVWPLPRITFRELSSIEETRPIALLTTEAVWATLNTRLTLPVLIQAEPARNDGALFEYLAQNLPGQVQAIYALGSGAPVAAGKMIAAQNNVPLVIIPTALDSAQMLMPTILVEKQDDNAPRLMVEETGPATEIIIDWSIIQAAPDAQRGAGIVDVLSIVTGLLDWRYSAQQGKNPRDQHFVPWAAGVVTGLVKEAIKISAAVGQGQREALQTLLELMLTMVQVSNQLGHTRVQQGSEHYLAQILATTVHSPLVHAERVGPCLLFGSVLHGQNPVALNDALNNAGVRLGQVRATDFSLMLDNLPAYLDAYNFPYSILNTIIPESNTVLEALDRAGLALEVETWEKPEETRHVNIPLSVAGTEAPHEHKVLADMEELTRDVIDDALPDSDDESAPRSGDTIDWLNT